VNPGPRRAVDHAADAYLGDVTREELHHLIDQLDEAKVDYGYRLAELRKL
jgi:hypothetical protein